MVAHAIHTHDDTTNDWMRYVEVRREVCTQACPVCRC